MAGGTGGGGSGAVGPVMGLLIAVAGVFVGAFAVANKVTPGGHDLYLSAVITAILMIVGILGDMFAGHRLGRRLRRVIGGILAIYLLLLGVWTFFDYLPGRHHPPPERYPAQHVDAIPAGGDPLLDATKFRPSPQPAGEVAWEGGDIQVGKKTYLNSIYVNPCGHGATAQAERSYPLGGKYDSLYVAIGVNAMILPPDDNIVALTASRTYIIEGDGRILLKNPAQAGKPTTFKVPLRGVQRLTLRVASTDNSGGRCHSDVFNVFGQPTLFATPTG